MSILSSIFLALFAIGYIATVVAFRRSDRFMADLPAHVNRESVMRSMI